MKNRQSPKQNFSAKVVTIAIAGLLLISTGCTQKLKTGYGHSRGIDYTNSVNGTLVLNKMIRSSRRRVRHYRKISPRWDQYDTIFWVPDDFAPPSEAAIDKAEAWLTTIPDRTLVYIARDYDASIVYWDRMRKGKGTNAREARDYADALSGHIARSNQASDENCSWYDWHEGPFKKAKTVAGILAQSLNTDEAEIHYCALPVPGDITDAGTFNDYDVEVLLSVDSIPFVYSLTKEDWNGGRIIIVGNGSLALNLPLTQPVNQQLTANLLETVDESTDRWSNILFVENDGQISISDVDIPDNASKWYWITKPPLRYMVPNLVFWCMLFCFVYFPIFGRPRNIERKSTSNFQDHIFALAKLVNRTENRQQPNQWLEQYRKNSNRNQKLK